MIKKVSIILLTAAMLVLSVITEPILADVAVSLSTGYMAWPAAGSNHGWQFTVNEPIVVTHLGLFDRSDNGFFIDHPIGLWRLSDSALLASGTMSAGTGDTRIDHFRYIDVPDVDLSFGVDYVIGYYSASAFGDRAVLEAGDLQVDPAIDIIVRRDDGNGGFQMPANIYEWDPMHDPYYPDMFGPNFQFIPEPGTILLLGLGGLALLRKRCLKK